MVDSELGGVSGFRSVHNLVVAVCVCLTTSRAVTQDVLLCLELATAHPTPLVEGRSPRPRCIHGNDVESSLGNEIPRELAGAHKVGNAPVGGNTLHHFLLIGFLVEIVITTQGEVYCHITQPQLTSTQK